MNNPLAKLALDHWYKALMTVGFVTFAAADGGLLKALPATATAITALGVFFVGLGEWANHPLKTIRLLDNFDRTTGIISGHSRDPRPIGMAFNTLGAALILAGAYRLVAA